MNTDFFIIMKAEWCIIFIVFLLLFLKVGDYIKSNETLFRLTNILLLLNFLFGFFYNSSGELFNGMFYNNNVIILQKNILNFGTLIISLQAYDWLKVHKHLSEFYILLLSSLLGMFFMISAGNFLIFYLALELATIPLAALVNFNLDKRKSAEAAIKMILSSAFASGVMLFGISFLYGTTGSLWFSDLTDLITGEPIQIFALIFIFSGFAFKLSAVPFHFWTADVYEGAPTSITSFLSVISKSSVVFVFISVLSPLFIALPQIWHTILIITIVLSITVGNLFAIRQNNIKRFLAFSSIAQVGYILLGLSSAGKAGIVSSIYFLIIYLFSNLGIFGVVALVSSKTGKETIDDYRGFYKTNPWLSWIITISLFSLAGIPPTAGFFGKMFLIANAAGSGNIILIAFAALNMVVSLYYYLRIVKAIFIDENEFPLPVISAGFSVKLSLIICLFGIIVTGFVSGVYQYISNLF